MLIQCPECGNQISDKATTCPHCSLADEQATSTPPGGPKLAADSKPATFQWIAVAALAVMFMTPADCRLSGRSYSSV